VVKRWINEIVDQGGRIGTRREWFGKKKEKNVQKFGKQQRKIKQNKFPLIRK
jgi:hypothetical protein